MGSRLFEGSFLMCPFLFVLWMNEQCHTPSPLTHSHTHPHSLTHSLISPISFLSYHPLICFVIVKVMFLVLIVLFFGLFRDRSDQMRSIDRFISFHSLRYVHRIILPMMPCICFIFFASCYCCRLTFFIFPFILFSFDSCSFLSSI